MDEWGYIDENRKASSNEQAKIEGPKSLSFVPALEPWSEFLSPLKAYSQAARGFLDNVVAVLEENERVVKISNDSPASLVKHDGAAFQGAIRLSVEQSFALFLASQRLRKSFREHLADLFSDQRLTAIERQEQEVLDHFWKLWRAYALVPQHTVYRPRRTMSSEWKEFGSLVDSALEHHLASLSDLQLTVQFVVDGPKWNELRSLWIIVDSEDAVRSNTALNAVVAKAHRAFVEAAGATTSLYGVSDRWSQVVVVPLFRGRSLASSAWRIPCSVIQNAESFHDLEKYHGIPHQVPGVVLDHLGVQIWDYPELAALNPLLDAARDFLALGAHLESLISIPELDDLGKEIFRSHIHLVLQWIADANEVLALGEAEVDRALSSRRSFVGREDLIQLRNRLGVIRVQFSSWGASQATVLQDVKDLAMLLYDVPSIATTAYLILTNRLEAISE